MRMGLPLLEDEPLFFWGEVMSDLARFGLIVGR